MKKLFLYIVLLILSYNCTQIHYEISARKDPFQGDYVKIKKFSIEENENADDPLIDKNLLFIISESLKGRGWEFVNPENAEFIFKVDYEIDKGNTVTKSGSIPVTSQTYNPQTGKYTKHVTQQAYSNSRNVFTRRVSISVTSNSTNSVLWTADCTSRGTTEDVLFAAKYMLPTAISVFPMEGIWKKSEVTN